MKTFVNIVCIGVIALALLGKKVELPSMPDFDFGFSTKQAELVKPANMYDFDVSLPRTITDKATAHKIVGIFTGLADEIERDGTKSKPEVRYIANVFDSVKEAVNIKFDGKSLNEVSPHAGDEIGTVLNKELADGATELDSTSRKKIVEIFRAISYGCSMVK